MGRGKLLLVLDVLWNVLAMNLHVLIDYHVTDHEKIFEICTSAVASAAVGIGDNAVPVEFSVDEADGRGANILIGIQEISTDGHADSPLFGFAGAHCAHKLGIGYFSAGRDLIWEDEEHCVVATNAFTDRVIEVEALCTASPFV